MKSLQVWLILCMTTLALVACRSSDSPTVAPTSHTSPLESPLPTAIPVTEQIIPTPGSETGVVVGSVEVEGSGDPMGAVQVFLGQPVGSDSEAAFFGLDPSNAPGTEADEHGHFIIPDVPPGDYVVILWNPVNSILARDRSTQEPLVLSVGAGEVVDVGRLTEPRP